MKLGYQPAELTALVNDEGRDYTRKAAYDIEIVKKGTTNV